MSAVFLKKPGKSVQWAERDKKKSRFFLRNGGQSHIKLESTPVYPKVASTPSFINHG